MIESKVFGKPVARLGVCILVVLLGLLGTPGRPPAANAAGNGSSWYFAEGYTGEGFQEYICLANHGTEQAVVRITFIFNGGGFQEETLTVPARSRSTLDVNRAVGPGREVSIVVESDRSDLAVERPMYFTYKGARTGSHTVSGAPSPSSTLYFAEGYTGDNFDEYVCVLNPRDGAASLTFRFQTAGSGEVVKSGLAVSGRSRATFKINDLLGNGMESSLELEADTPVVAERATYFRYAGTSSLGWSGGHCVMGAGGLSNEFFFAEGTTRNGFEEWLTLQNPGDQTIRVNAVYQLGPGQGDLVQASYEIPPKRRYTVFVADEVGAEKDVGVKLSSAGEFLAERPLYFCFERSGLRFEGGQCAVGAYHPSYSLLFAEGYTGPFFEVWLCLQNSSDEPSLVGIDYLTQESGELPTRTVTVPAGSRVTVCVNDHAGPDYQLATDLDVLSGPPVVVERPLYFDSTHWSPPAPVDSGPLYGLCFSPYLTEDPLNGGWVTPERIGTLLDVIAPYTSWIRTFGSQGELEGAPAMVKARGMMVAAGCDIWTDPGGNQEQVDALIGQIHGGDVDIAVVGDEVMLTDALPESRLVGYIRQVRATGVPTGTSDTWDQWVEHPGLANECDVVLVNVYPYWEGYDVGGSVEILASHYQEVREVAPGKRIIIETGWPSGGETRGDAVASPENAARYLSDFRKWADSAGVEYFYFEAFDEQWKVAREGACGAYWGVWDSSASLKPGSAGILSPRY